MSNKKLIYLIIVALILIVSSIYLWNNYQIQITEKTIKPLKLPPQISGKCGIENCHGLDIVCGPNIAEMCTAMYMAGDNCRQFASCEEKDGKCQLVQSIKFESCKTCVEKCENNYQEDPIKFFECESKCAE